MVDERPRLAASEIEAMLRAALQKLPSLESMQDRGGASRRELRKMIVIAHPESWVTPLE